MTQGSPPLARPSGWASAARATPSIPRLLSRSRALCEFDCSVCGSRILRPVAIGGLGPRGRSGLSHRPPESLLAARLARADTPRTVRRAAYAAWVWSLVTRGDPTVAPMVLTQRGSGRSHTGGVQGRARSARCPMHPPPPPLLAARGDRARLRRLPDRTHRSSGGRLGYLWLRRVATVNTCSRHAWYSRTHAT